MNLRLRRALSWLGRAEKEYTVEDFDAAFIFYWIAFNAMYGQLGTSSVDEAYEKDRRRNYFDRIVAFADAESVNLRRDLVSASGRRRENAGESIRL